VVPLPESIPDDVGAQLMINAVTALTVIRTAHDSLPPDALTNVVTLLTAAGSAVGRLIGAMLTERGVKVIRLVRSEAGAAKLAGVLPGSPVFATETAGWKDRVRAAAEGAKVHVAIDSVGGRLLGDLAELLAERTGTVINFGSLGGEMSDIRLFFATFADAQRRRARQLDAAAAGATQSRHRARIAPGERVADAVRDCRALSALPDRRRGGACRPGRPRRRHSDRFLERLRG